MVAIGAMKDEIPPQALRAGVVVEPIGTHGSRTIMLAELRLLLAACRAPAHITDYRVAIVHDNALLKNTVATRRESFRRLRELYALNADLLLFRALREMWDEDVQAQPLLALLCACARDPLLRATAELVLATPLGDTVTPQGLARTVDACFPGRYNATMLANIGRHAASSWQQSGHLSGRLGKVRARAESRLTSVAYALLLSYLCGGRGEMLFHTLWSRLLDGPVQSLHDQAVTVARQGWIDYRHSGAVTDIGFSHFLHDES